MVRINIEVTEEQRRKLKSRLALEGITLKEWLIKKIDEYITRKKKPNPKRREVNEH